MLRKLKREVAGQAFAVAFAVAFVAAAEVSAQQAKDPPAAPLPAQIVSGKKAFVSNASGEQVIASGVSELTYNEFYADMKSWGRYELVSTPADADLVFEVRYQRYSEVRIIRGEGGSGGELIGVRILDPKTHVVLWAFTENIKAANRQATGRKNFDQAMGNLVEDIKKLAGQAAASGAAGG
jgi:hypothetical protein